MRVRAIPLAGAILAFMQPAASSAQGDVAPVAQQDVAVATAPAAEAVTAVPPAASAPAEPAAAASVAAATPASSPAAPEPAAVDDPMICRTEVETGTIGRRNKICMPKSQWEKHRQATRKFLKAVEQSRATQPGGESLGP